MPASRRGRSTSSTRRMISSPLSSSPWMTAESHSRGPGRWPLSTTMGRLNRVVVGRRATGTSMSRLRPGATVVPAISTGRFRAAREARVVVEAMAGRSGLAAASPGPGGVALLDPLDDPGGHVAAGGGLDALEPRRAVHLQHERAVPGSDEVDTAHVETHGPGSAHRHGPFLGGQPDLLGRAAPVEVGAELAGCALS